MKNNKQITILANQDKIKALSHARLSSYRVFFNTQSDEETLGLYQWNEELSAAIFRTISLTEIVLRNQCHTAMSMRYGVAGSTNSRDWCDHVDLNTLSRKKITDVTHTKQHQQWVPKVPVPSPDDVVSRLTFGFWPHLLDLRQDMAHQPIAWGPIILDILPGHRQRQVTHWSKQKHRDALFARFDLCNEMRNRIAHHEPIWKIGPLMEETRARQGNQPAIVAQTPTTPSEALNRLKLLYTRLTELLAWLSPEMARAHALSDVHHKCLSLLSLQALEAYRKTKPPIVLNLAQYKSHRALKKALRLATRHQQPTLLMDGHRTLGNITCIPSAQ